MYVYLALDPPSANDGPLSPFATPRSIEDTRDIWVLQGPRSTTPGYGYKYSCLVEGVFKSSLLTFASMSLSNLLPPGLSITDAIKLFVQAVGDTFVVNLGSGRRLGYCSAAAMAWLTTCHQLQRRLGLHMTYV